jgi:hypothetical protein
VNKNQGSHNGEGKIRVHIIVKGKNQGFWNHEEKLRFVGEL